MKLTEPLSLPDALRVAEEAEPSPLDDRLAALALAGLGVRESALDTWYRRAWFGWAAARIIQARARSGRGYQLDEIVEETPTRHGEGLFVGAHIGPPCLARSQLARGRQDLLALATKTRAVGDESLYLLDNELARKRAPLEVLTRLEAGLSVYLAADGRRGESVASGWLFARQVEIRSKLPVLAAIAGASTSFFVANWVGRRVGFTHRSLPTATESGYSDWVSAYLGQIEETCRDDPANLRLRGGVWTRQAGGVFDA